MVSVARDGVSHVSTTTVTRPASVRYRLVRPERRVEVPELDEHQQRVVDHRGGVLVTDNQGRAYPLACCLAPPQLRQTLMPGEVVHVLAQFAGDAAQPGISELHITFKQVGPILDASWVFPLVR